MGFDIVGVAGADGIVIPVIDMEMDGKHVTLRGADQIKARFTKAELRNQESELWIFDNASPFSVGIPKADFAFHLMRHVYGL